jgi:hypothetical protein
VFDSSETLVLLVSALWGWLLPFRALFACSLLLICGWTIISAVIDVIAKAKQMHRVPCTHCRFFTSDYRLKCPVQPSIANTELAIDCSDYQPNT